MNWYNYIACFFSGVFFSNFIPHFVNGISGNKFPTPFAKPPGKGLSSPTLNVLWGMFNLIISAVLIWCGKVSTNNYFSIIVMFSGFFVASVLISRSASKKHEE